MPDAFTVLIMAAGKGTRMHSETPKVLHRVCGKPLVEWVIDTARVARARKRLREATQQRTELRLALLLDEE